MPYCLATYEANTTTLFLNINFCVLDFNNVLHEMTRDIFDIFV